MANNDRVSELYRGEIFDAETAEKCRRRIHWLCRQTSGSRILEIGCSQGVTSILLGREGYEVVGIDVEEAALEYASRALAEESPAVVARVSFEIQDGRATHFPDASFDTVILGEVIEHLTQPALLLAETQRILKPGGSVLVTTPLGILAHPDHKQTFMVGNFLDLVEPFFETRELELVDKTIFYKAVRRDEAAGAEVEDAVQAEALDTGSDSMRLASALLRQLDEQFLLRDREALRLTRTCEEIYAANRDLRKQVNKLGDSATDSSGKRALQGAELRRFREDAEVLRANLVEARAEILESAGAAGTISGLRDRCGELVEELRTLREELQDSANGQQMSLHVARKDQEKLESELRATAREAGAAADLRVRCELLDTELSAARETFAEEIRDLTRQVAGAAEVRLRNTALESEVVAGRERDEEHRQQLRAEAIRLAQLEERTRSLVGQNSELQAARDATTLETRSIQAQLAEQIARTGELGGALEEAKRRESAIEAEVSRLTGLAEAAALRAESHEAQSEQQLAQLAASDSKRAALQDELRRLAFEAGAAEELRTRCESLGQQRETVAAQLAEQTSLLRGQRERADELEGSLSETREKWQTLTNEKLRLEDVVRATEHTTRELKLENEQARQEIESSLARVGLLDRDLTTARGEVDRLSTEASLSREETQRAAETHSAVVQQVEKLRAEAEQIPRMQGELASLLDRVESEKERVFEAEALCEEERSGRATANELAVVRGAEVERLQERAARLEQRTASLEVLVESEQSARARLNDSLHRYTDLAKRRELEISDIRTSGAFRLAYVLSRAARPLGAQRIMRYVRGRPARRASTPGTGADESSSSGRVPAKDEPATPKVDIQQTSTAIAGGAATSLTAAESPAKLRIAGILDEFSRACFAPDCDLSTFRPDNWQATLESSPPELLLVESAWHGNEDAWVYRIASYEKKFGDELHEVIDWCRKRSIPTVFWNKEDPVHYDRFVESAARFDVVLTSDAKCVERYQAALGHDRVHALPFAAQPVIHNPLSSSSRLAKTCFAGTYYRGRHSQRRTDMELVLEPALEYGLDIYDRTFGTVGPGAQEFGFPEIYQSSVRGRLEYEDVVQAYKKYQVFLNVNSVTDSPTMFSRRVFELLACGTPVVSAYALGIERVLGGDLVRMSRSAKETREHLDALLHDPETWSRSSAAGLCRVLADHTYSQRLASVASIVGLGGQEVAGDTIAAIVRIGSDAELQALERFVSRQTRAPDEILAVRTGKVSERRLRALRRTLSPIPVEWKDAGDIAGIEGWRAESKSTHVALIRAADFYGPSYLEESLLAFAYSPASFVGRTAHYRWDGRGVELQDETQEHAIAEQAPWGSLVGRRDALTEALVNGAAGQLAVSVPGSVCAFHRYNYAQSVPGASAPVPALPPSGSSLKSLVLDWKRAVD